MRRFPLHAYATCAALLIGCESPVAVPPAAPPHSDPSLSVEISGPSRIDSSGPFSWQAIVFGGSGEYRYRWEVTHQAGQQSASTAQEPISTSTDRTLSLLVTDTDGDMVLRLTVTSGDQANVQSFRVRNCIRGCDALQ